MHILMTVICREGTVQRREGRLLGPGLGLIRGWIQKKAAREVDFEVRGS